MRRRARLDAAFGIVFVILIATSSANPLKRPKRGEESEILSYNSTLLLGPQTACTVGDIVYQIGESVPGSDPCEKCACTGQSEDGTGVKCHFVQCEVKPGCKALHRADHCCPLYQCECTRNGKIYSNGEKLKDAENPCEVCYCQGGEIVCNRIACFIRNDCEPIYKEGSCCPEYDHCPPRDVDREVVPKQEDKVFYSSDGSVKQELKETSKVDINNLPKIQIKEVTKGKPINNEIRIKEVTPVSTKAPTFPREVSVIYKYEDENQTKNDINETDLGEETSVESSQSPQILRIGDQLLFLKEGEIIPENTSVITPSPVFTVIGAEGLQRVEDDFDDALERESMDAETSSKSIINKIDAPLLPNIEETKGLDELIEETLSELYASTTQEPPNYDNDNMVTPRVYKGDNGELLDNNYTDKPNTIPLSTSSDSLDDDIQTVPSEHLPELNPEYPPIPEDIMILSMTEDTLEPMLGETDINGENPSDGLKSQNDEKIVIVKRPVIPLSIPKQTKSPNLLRDANNIPEKILPDILPLIRVNKTEGDNETSVPEEWLKEEIAAEINSPLLNLDAALPESILQKTSVEEDDSKEYIFVTNDTFKNSDINIQKNEITTDGNPELNTENYDFFTDTFTNKGIYRSPGEPHLIPEWERNQTSYAENAETIQDNTINLIDNVSTENTSLGIYMRENITNDNDIDEENGIPDESYILDNSSTVKPLVVYEMFNNSNSNDSNIDDFDFDESTSSTDNLKHISSTSSFIKSILELETFGDGETLSPYDEKIYPQKQKKTSALIGDKNDDTGKKRNNILADLINLVGDVAAIGHDTEVSTVLNSIDSQGKNEYKSRKGNYPIFDMDNVAPIDNAVTSSNNLYENSNIELTEYNASGDRIDETPLENDKVEFTTRKILIDKEIDPNSWKVEEVGKDIELIPKVEKNPPKKDPSLEKIKDSNHVPQYQLSKNKLAVSSKAGEEDVIIYTTVQENPMPPAELNTPAPKNKTMMRAEDILETLITIDDENKPRQNTELDTTENSLTSTIMKVTGKSSHAEESTNNINEEEGDKVAKRETNSQMISPKDIIDDKYLDVLKSYFEQRFIH